MSIWSNHWKIFELKHDDLYTLFYGLDDASRKITPGPSIYWASNKWVRDGSGDGWYWSGFHVFIDKGKAEQYLQNFTAERCLVVREVQVKYLSTKPSNRDVTLAQAMMVPKLDEE